MAYVTPSITRSAVTVRAATDPRPADCPACAKGGYPVPHWPNPRICNSSYRKDDDGVERLFRVHCTCDWCF